MEHRSDLISLSVHFVRAHNLLFVSDLLFVFSEVGEVYTWGWKECVPSGKVFGDPSAGTSSEKDVFERQNLFLTEQGNSIPPIICNEKSGCLAFSEANVATHLQSALALKVQDQLEGPCPVWRAEVVERRVQNEEEYQQQNKQLKAPHQGMKIFRLYHA